MRKFLLERDICSDVRFLLTDRISERTASPDVGHSPGHSQAVFRDYPEKGSARFVIDLMAAGTLRFWFDFEPLKSDRAIAFVRLLCDHLDVAAQSIPLCLRGRELSGEGVSLPPRLRQVLRLLLEGCSRKEIAAILSLSSHTVSDYVADLYKRLGVHSKSELFHWYHANRDHRENGGLLIGDRSAPEH